MEDSLEHSFMSNDFDVDNEDILLLSLLKRFSYFIDKYDSNHSMMMDRLNELEKNVKPRMYATVG